MATQKQQQEEMVNTFIASIPAMQTDIALLKQDTAILKKASEAQSVKSDAIIARLEAISFVSPAEFDGYKQGEQLWKDNFARSMDERFNKIEGFINDSKPGIKFANALVSRWTTFLVLLLLTAAVIALVGHFMPVSGGL